jgi:hypothetical protein
MYTISVDTDLGKTVGNVEKMAVVRAAVPTPSNILSAIQTAMKVHFDGIRDVNL